MTRVSGLPQRPVVSPKRRSSTNIVVVTPAGKGPADIGSGGLALKVLLDAPSGTSIATIISACRIDMVIRMRMVFSCEWRMSDDEAF